MQSSPLELQFSVERLRRFLHENPDQAARLAIAYFEDFSVLAIEHKQMENDFHAMQSHLIQLQQQQPSPKSPKLPHFLSNL